MDTPLRSLYLCYLSLEDPLVHTQVLAYLSGLVDAGHTVHLLTYDPPLDAARRRQIDDSMRESGIGWHSLRYHKRPSLPATVYDALAGAIVAARIVRRHGLTALHARNHVPLATALIARRLTGSRLIFDIRGLMAEEYADAGRWKEGGIPYRLTQRMQRAGLRQADAIVTLTEAVRPHLFGAATRPGTHVIPCCADVEQIQSQAGERDRVKTELGLAERRVMVYVGKFSGWYMEREMVEFFAAARRTEPRLAFLILTQSDRGLIAAEFSRAGVDARDYVITQSPPETVGSYLAAADFGISFIKRCFSKISSSPTKIGEYLAAGLPVASSAGIGDVDRLIGENNTGVLVDEFGARGFEQAAAAVLALLDDPGAPERCRDVARRELSLRDVGIPRYDHLYREVAALS